MAAAADTMYMTMSPGLDALKSSPLSASSESLQLGDYLDLSSMGSPMMPAAATPSLSKQQPAPVSMLTPPSPQPIKQQASLAAQTQPATAAAPSAPSSSRNTAASASTSARSAQSPDLTPPPPGSPPENIFRYYLKLELRKMGSPADDSIIDKYVQQHYGTFLKAMENGRGGATATAATSAAPRPSVKQGVDPTPSSSSPSATDKKPRVASSQATSNASPAPASETLSSVSPQPQPQPFKVPMTRAPTEDDDMSFDNFAIKTEPTEHPLFSHIDPQYMQLGHGVPASDVTAKALREQEEHLHHHPPASASTSTAPPPLRRRPSDAMSEDDQHLGADENHDELAPLVSSMRFGSGGDKTSFAGSSDSGSCRGGSEEPIGVPGSIRDSAAANLRPTAEEYRALSSKEKRQLRNKISARNFRERRKEYITHLEGEIADRDAIISSLRQQMSNMSVHTKKLEDEVKTLQARQLSPSDVSKILEALGQAAGMPLSSQENNNQQQQQQSQPVLSALRPSAAADVSLSAAGTPGILSSRPSTPSSPRPPFMRRGSPGLPQHNPRKDISASGTSASAKSGSFWGSGPTVAASA